MFQYKAKNDNSLDRPENFFALQLYDASQGKRHMVLPFDPLSGDAYKGEQDRARKKTKNVWLTFDDGPHESYTEQVLKTLSEHGITATFFILGKNAVDLLQVLKQIYGQGHRIGNHSFTHPDFTKLSENEIQEEIQQTEQLISPYLTGEKLFRPPYGARNATVDRVVRDLGYRLVFWNVDTLDWNERYQPEGWIQHGFEQMRSRDNCKILNHDIKQTTAENLGKFISRIVHIGNVVFQPAATL